MKYATCNFNLHSGQVYVDDGSFVWHDGTVEEAKEKVKSSQHLCALFFPGDVPGCGVPIKPDVTREEFEVNPAAYGVCYYRGWNGCVFE